MNLKKRATFRLCFPCLARPKEKNRKNPRGASLLAEPGGESNKIIRLEVENKLLREQLATKDEDIRNLTNKISYLKQEKVHRLPMLLQTTNDKPSEKPLQKKGDVFNESKAKKEAEGQVERLANLKDSDVRDAILINMLINYEKRIFNYQENQQSLNREIGGLGARLEKLSDEVWLLFARIFLEKVEAIFKKKIAQIKETDNEGTSKNKLSKSKRKISKKMSPESQKIYDSLNIEPRFQRRARLWSEIMVMFKDERCVENIKRVIKDKGENETNFVQCIVDFSEVANRRIHEKMMSIHIGELPFTAYQVKPSGTWIQPLLVDTYRILTSCNQTKNKENVSGTDDED